MPAFCGPAETASKTGCPCEAGRAERCADTLPEISAPPGVPGAFGAPDADAPPDTPAIFAPPEAPDALETPDTPETPDAPAPPDAADAPDEKWQKIDTNARAIPTYFKTGFIWFDISDKM